MLLYLFMVTTKTNGEIKKSVYDYSDHDKAEADFHSEIGKAMKSADVAKHEICLLNSTMYIEMSHVWERKKIEEVNE